MRGGPFTKKKSLLTVCACRPRGQATSLDPNHTLPGGHKTMEKLIGLNGKQILGVAVVAVIAQRLARQFDILQG